jgi:5'-methylthioadenosine nucleosidase
MKAVHTNSLQNQLRQSCDPERPVINVAIIMAMEAEAAPVIRALDLINVTETLSFTPFYGLTAYQGMVNGQHIHLIINGRNSAHGVDGIGTVNATITATEVMRIIAPDTIISAGTAGGYADKGADIGDIYISNDHFVYHDRRIPLANFEGYGIGDFPCLDTGRMIDDLNLKSGIISTGNSLDVSHEDQTRLNQSGAIAKEMEVAAIAEVAQMAGIRVVAVKSITNLAGVKTDAPGQFGENFDNATNALASTLPRVLSYLINKTPAQLRRPISSLTLLATPLNTEVQVINSTE